MAQTRREFLKSSAMGVSVSFLAPQLLFGAGNPLAPDKILVILQLAGGNDCVNTFIPYTDSKYRSLRPSLGIADNQILKIDDRTGFHPSLAKLESLYRSGKFAYVNNVGFTTLDRSHFRCQDVWQTGDDSYGQVQRGVRGWLGRYADVYLTGTGSPMTTVSIGSKSALGLRANEVKPTAITSAEGFQILTDPRYPSDADAYVTSVRATYDDVRSSSDLELIRQQGIDTFGAIDLVKSLPPASPTITYPDTALGRGFSLVGQILGGNVGTNAIWISSGGYDTHATQLTTHANLLADVAGSLAVFQDDLAARGLSDRVIVLGWSEFGRRVQENASAGTDHGKAGTVFLLGNKIKGGTFYGGMQDLSNLDAGDLKTNIDFRSLYWTIIEDWFGKDPLPVLNAKYNNLGFINKVASNTGRRRGVTFG